LKWKQLKTGKFRPRLETAFGTGIPFKKADKSSGSGIPSANLTMPQFADTLAPPGPSGAGYDRVGGGLRVSLEWADEHNTTKPGKISKARLGHRPPIDLHRSSRPNGPARLQARKSPVKIIVIDHIEKTPTAN
jgi:uncharacterized protein (TIGR03435 family)